MLIFLKYPHEVDLYFLNFSAIGKWILFRDFTPKGTSMEPFCNEDILNIADALNQRPRRILGYHTPMELFEAFLDEVYNIDNIS